MLGIRPQSIHHTAARSQPTFKGQGNSTPNTEKVSTPVPPDSDVFVARAETVETPPDPAILEWAKQIQDIVQPASEQKVTTTETPLSKHYTKDASNPDTFGQAAIDKAHEIDRSNRSYLDDGFLLGMIQQHELPYTPLAGRREHARDQLMSALTNTADVIRKVVPQLHGVDLLQPNEPLKGLYKAFAELHKSNKHAKDYSVGLTLQEILERLPQVQKEEQS